MIFKRQPIETVYFKLPKTKCDMKSITSGTLLQTIPAIAKDLSTSLVKYSNKDILTIKSRKGYNLRIAGDINNQDVEDIQATRISISPYDYRGIAPIPKVVVKPGDEVKAGDVLFYDKLNPDIKYTSPVSGEFVDIKRGAKRSISEVMVLVDKEQKYKKLSIPVLDNQKDLQSFLAESGLWVDLSERPFDIVPKLGTQPRDIFITTFDTGPLAPNSKVLLNGQEKAYAKGLEVLSKLTEGKVYVGLDGNSNETSPFFIKGIDKVEYRAFVGKHPMGNVGVHIHKVSPIAMKEKVWTIDLQDVIRWGNTFNNGQIDGTKIYALTGYGLSNPKYVRSYIGVAIEDLLQGQELKENVRIISGDVLTGKKKEKEEFISVMEDQLTVIAEGDEFEFLGWLLPFNPKPSISKTFPSFLFPNARYEATTNTQGEERAFVVTGHFEQVMPMNIYIQQLMKAILVEDLEKMEGLGILELTEEDVALCEFVSVSKAPIQEILREGLNLVQAQG